MGVLDELGDIFRRKPRGPLWQRPPELPPVQQPPAALDPMRVDPEKRTVEMYKFLNRMQQERQRTQPYGPGYSETQVQPGGATDPFSIKRMNQEVAGRSSSEGDDMSAEHYTRLNTDATRKLPREYQTSVAEEERMARLLQNLRPQFPAAPPLPPRRPPGY